MSLILNEVHDLEQKCNVMYGEEGAQDAETFKECRDLVKQWMQKAEEAMEMYTDDRAIHLGPQTYSAGSFVRDGSNTMTRRADSIIRKAHDSSERALSLLAQMRADCWERLTIELDDL